MIRPVEDALLGLVEETFLRRTRREHGLRSGHADGLGGTQFGQIDQEDLGRNEASRFVAWNHQVDKRRKKVSTWLICELS